MVKGMVEGVVNGVPGLGSVVELAEVVRSGFVESRHFGLAVALDPDGKQLFAAGEVDSVVLPRSTAKPLQAVGCLVAGAELSEEEAAIAAGSHTGEDRHVALVDGICCARWGLIGRRWDARRIALRTSRPGSV